MGFKVYDLSGNPQPASKLRRLKRATAERMIDELIDRAWMYNEDNSRLLIIENIRLFGSYLTDLPTFGDIDISVSLVRKPGWSVEAVLDQANEEAPTYILRSYLSKLGWDDTEARQRLRNGSGYFHMLSPDELERLPCAKRTIFEAGASLRELRKLLPRSG